MDTALLNEYRRQRRGDGMPMAARDALNMARYRTKDVDDYGWAVESDPRTYAGEALTLQRDGFTIRATWTYDEGMSLDDMGYGTFDQERGADRWAVPMYQSSQGITPTTGDHANIWYHPMYSGDDWYAYARKRGASRQTADEWTRAAAEREARLAAEATEYVLTVTASRADVELGTSSLGGVGFDDDYDTARQVAAVIEENGMIAEAITEARATLRALREDA